MTTAVQKALRHVHEFHPEVNQVVYGIDGRWMFFGENFKIPSFGPEIDTSLLEDAADSIESLPAVFALDSGNGQ